MSLQVGTTSSHAGGAGVRAAVIAGLAASLALALTVGATGAMRAAPPWVIPLYVVGANVALVVAYRRRGAFRAYVEALPWQALALPHMARAPIGAGFLVLMARGVMPASLALHAGLGDIAAGLGVAAIAAAPMRDETRRRWLRAWNVFGLVDIVSVVLGFQRALLFERHAGLADAFPRLPFPLLPFFVVPLVVATHLALAARLRGTTSAVASSSVAPGRPA